MHGCPTGDAHERQRSEAGNKGGAAQDRHNSLRTKSNKKAKAFFSSSLSLGSCYESATRHNDSTPCPLSGKHHDVAALSSGLLQSAHRAAPPPQP